MGFLNPSNLLLGLSLAALLAVYLRSRSRPLIEVSSLMLLEESPAPVARSRILRLDALFWLEAGALAALTLIWAGLYFRTSKPASKVSHHALVFDLSAAMGAQAHGATRLAQAKHTAFALVSKAPADFQFSVIGYSQEAKILHAANSQRDQLRRAIDSLRVQDVPARQAALREALIDARDAEQIDLFTNSDPPAALLSELRERSKITVHPFAEAVDNLAIVSLDPGIPKSTEGRCLVRNFSPKPQICELKIDNSGHEALHSTLIIEPRAQSLVRFGPLPAGGLVHAQILTEDGLTADNNRYAIAPQITPARALVASPDNAARDDLARILLAIRPSYQVTAIDPATMQPNQLAHQRFDLAVLHDFDGAGISAAARLFVFPEPSTDRTGPLSALRIAKSVAMAELQGRAGEPPLATPLLLGPSRVVTLPAWMDPLASGNAIGDPAVIPLAAAGVSLQGPVGLIAFDVRNHLLLDPDHLTALLLAIDTVRTTTRPATLRVVPTGAVVRLSTFEPATLISPDRSHSTLTPDTSGRVQFNPDEAGKYIVTGGGTSIEIYANYYDETESDLAKTSSAQPAKRVAPPDQPAVSRETRVVVPSSSLIVLVVIIVLFHSALLVWRGRQRSVLDV
jgi:hypothetical protein